MHTTTGSSASEASRYELPPSSDGGCDSTTLPALAELLVGVFESLESILRQHQFEFVIKTLPAMVDFLISNIVPGLVHKRLRNPNGEIFMLPRKLCFC